MTVGKETAMMRRCHPSKLGLLALGFTLALSSGLVWAMGSRVPAVGTAAEDFRLVDLEGKQQSLSQYRGKVVLVNFWATWCKPCTTEMPAMQATYDKLREKGFVVLAVNELEDEAKVREHIKQHGHTFPVLMDRDNKVANQFGVFGLPVSVFIDEKGVVQEYIKGGLLTEQVILDAVARIQKPEPMKAASLH
ncbi:MAG: TlpA family protein disulfide reductase [Nitrospira sp. CG24B]|nr:MAG: TlpA family protein disulfide reductase [Nitrospira sp. CG24B]